MAHVGAGRVRQITSDDAIGCGNQHEVHMVDDRTVLHPNNQFIGSGLVLGRFVEDMHGLCVLVSKACVISHAYGDDAQASVQLINTPGSENAVDVLIRQGQYYTSGGALMATINLNLPPRTQFNTCLGNFDAYETMLHEFGHALGMSGFEWTDFIRGSYPSDPIYHAAHPAVPDTVMNYDHKVPENHDPDVLVNNGWLRFEFNYNCSPNPLDLLALWALYQSVTGGGGGDD